MSRNNMAVALMRAEAARLASRACGPLRRVTINNVIVSQVARAQAGGRKVIAGVKSVGTEDWASAASPGIAWTEVQAAWPHCRSARRWPRRDRDRGAGCGYAETAAEALQAACLMGYVEYAGAAPSSSNTADSLHVAMVMGYVEAASEPSRLR